MVFSRPARFMLQRFLFVCLTVSLITAAHCSASAAQREAARATAFALKAASGKTGSGKAAPAKAAAPANAAAPARTGAKVEAPPKGFPITRVPVAAPAQAAKLPVAETWKPLMRRLATDGVEAESLQDMFGRLGDSYSHVPMGTKVAELFRYKYMPPPPRKPSKTPSCTPPVYKRLVAPESVEKCKAYLALHGKAFKAMEAAYGVPGEIVAGLLMVETRLGTYLGDNSSFWSLACLAAADTPDRVRAAVQELPLPMTPDKEEWLKKLLRERSAWAYKELLALIRHSKSHGLDPLVMPGSVYGAIGICQFMPSNLLKFAVDGNKDGKIDLFDPEDAIPSVGNYLKQHGWGGADRAARHATLKRYNKSTVYANTILAIAEAIAPQPGAGAAKKNSAKAARKAPAATKPAAKAAGNGAGGSVRKKTAAKPKAAQKSGQASTGKTAPAKTQPAEAAPRANAPAKSTD